MTRIDAFVKEKKEKKNTSKRENGAKTWRAIRPIIQRFTGDCRESPKKKKNSIAIWKKKRGSTHAPIFFFLFVVALTLFYIGNVVISYRGSNTIVSTRRTERRGKSSLWKTHEADATDLNQSRRKPTSSADTIGLPRAFLYVAHVERKESGTHFYVVLHSKAVTRCFLFPTKNRINLCSNRQAL